jgi:hypothetical protein
MPSVAIPSCLGIILASENRATPIELPSNAGKDGRNIIAKHTAVWRWFFWLLAVFVVFVLSCHNNLLR